MRPNTRLMMSAVVIIVSALYAVLVTQDPATAAAVAAGYVAIVGTIFVLNHFWRKP